MNWLRQNRSVGALLIVFGMCLLIVLILLYWTGRKWIITSNEFTKARTEASRLESLDPFPNDANYHALKGYNEKYRVALDQFKEELKKHAIPETPLAPNEFQSRLRQATVATLSRARASNVKLPDNFRLGFDEFATSMPKTAVAPFLGEELAQVQMLMNILLDAKVDSVTGFSRLPLTEETAAPPNATPVPGPSRAGRRATPTLAGAAAPKLIERDVIDLTFKAAPVAARRVLNDIVNSSGQFFIIRTLYVRNERDQGPPREKSAESPAGPDQGASTQQGAAAGPLIFIVGNEHIEVSATIEMLRFLF